MKTISRPIDPKQARWHDPNEVLPDYNAGGFVITVAGFNQPAEFLIEDFMYLWDIVSPLVRNVDYWIYKPL